MNRVGHTRMTLHRLAAHVLGRRRFEVSGRFGLRASPGGIATPAFGPDVEVLRISGTRLIREVGGASRVTPVSGRSLRELAAFAGTDVDADFSAGANAPQLGDPDAPLHLDEGDAAALAAWFGLAWTVLDRVTADLPPDRDPAAVQLWPEHLDAATTVTLPGAGKVNLGFSPGDAWRPDPYVYVGPWNVLRPGDPEFWNAPFGAALSSDSAGDGLDYRACVEFLEKAIDLLSAP